MLLLRLIPNVSRGLKKIVKNSFAQCNLIPISYRINFNRSKSLFTRYDQNFIYESELSVPVGGSIEISSPFNVELAPMDVESEAKDFDKAKFKVAVKENGEVAKTCTFSTQLVDNCYKFLGTSTKRELGKKVFCLGEIPIQNDIKAVISDLGSFTVEDMESKDISIETESGDITCKRLKCEYIRCHSVSGNVLCPGVVQGNIDIKTKCDGKVTGVRFQGKQVSVETEHGAVDISAIYSEISTFRSISGQMDLDNYHGNGTVKLQQGTINITGLDGSLRAEVESGNISVQVSRLEGLYLVNKNGNVDVKLPVNMRCRVELEGREISIEKRLQVQGRFKKKDTFRTFSGFLGAGKGPLIIILAPKGSVNIVVQDWMSSLELGGVIPEVRADDAGKEH